MSGRSFRVLAARDGSDREKILRVGHRGAAAYHPHNTRAAFEAALVMGVDQIETDLRRCASGEIVLAHDPEIHGPEGPRVSLASHSLPDLRSVDLGGGERVLTLEEFLELCRGRCGVMLDLKEEDFEVQLVTTLRDDGIEPGAVIIAGGSRKSRDRIRAAAPEYAVSLSLGGDPPGGISPAFVEGIDTPAVTWQHSMLTEERIGWLHQREKTIYAWTVDSGETMRRLMEWGVDGIITNRPDVLNEVMG